MSSSSAVPIAGSHCREAPSAGWHTENPLKAPTEPCRAMSAIVIGSYGKNRGVAKMSQSPAGLGSRRLRLEIGWDGMGRLWRSNVVDDDCLLGW